MFSERIIIKIDHCLTCFEIILNKNLFSSIINKLLILNLAIKKFVYLDELIALLHEILYGK
jgi:hypothetical protein